jgi:hypothetical protein
MKSKLGIVLLLCALNFNGVAVEAGLVPARVLIESSSHVNRNKNGQGLALPLQVNLSAHFLFTSLKPDGVAAVQTHRRKRRQRYSRTRAKIERASDTGGSSAGNAGPSAEPAEQPTMGAPAPAPPPVGARPEMASPGRGAARKRSSAPKIKPPTVQIKPPTR